MHQICRESILEGTKAMYSMQYMNFTVVIPAYNEAEGIQDVLQALLSYREQHNIDFSVIVVDDGSTDGTAETIQTNEHINVVSHPYNKGYGAALKTGIAAANTEWAITYDSDGQHTPDLISALVPSMSDGMDMVVGKREGYKGPWIRQPGKWLIQITANFLTERNIPDLNSGLRAFRRDAFMRYHHLFPNGFSLSTTSTVCFFKEGLNVTYVPISIQPRKGSSTVRPRDAGKTLMLVLRLTMLFSPLRIFLPASILLGIATVAIMGYEIYHFQNISDAGLALLSLTTILFFFGLLADQIASIRRERFL